MSPLFNLSGRLFSAPQVYFGRCIKAGLLRCPPQYGRSLVFVDAPVSNPYVLFFVLLLLINRPPQFTYQSANCLFFFLRKVRSQEAKKKLSVSMVVSLETPLGIKTF